jgi:hypothetical protein
VYVLRSLDIFAICRYFVIRGERNRNVSGRNGTPGRLLLGLLPFMLSRSLKSKNFYFFKLRAQRKSKPHLSESEGKNNNFPFKCCHEKFAFNPCKKMISLFDSRVHFFLSIFDQVCRTSFFSYLRSFSHIF